MNPEISPLAISIAEAIRRKLAGKQPENHEAWEELVQRVMEGAQGVPNTGVSEPTPAISLEVIYAMDRERHSRDCRYVGSNLPEHREGTHVQALLAPLLARIASLTAERDEAKDRLQIDPGGSDKIDELESAMEHLRAALASCDTELAQLLNANSKLTSELAMALDAAAKGEEGRKLGTAYEGVAAELAQVRWERERLSARCQELWSEKIDAVRDLAEARERLAEHSTDAANLANADEKIEELQNYIRGVDELNAAELAKERDHAEKAEAERDEAIEHRNNSAEFYKGELTRITSQRDEEVREARPIIQEASKTLDDLTKAFARACEDRDALRAQVQALRDALTTVLNSATPNSANHPVMFAAWKVGHAALTPTKPLAEAPGQGVDLIRAERLRQVSEEGWSAEHDDMHTDASLARAAACYAIARHNPAMAVMGWPWKKKDGGGYTVTDGYKPGGELRNLVKAGALIVAEIERIKRLPAPPTA